MSSEEVENASKPKDEQGVVKFYWNIITSEEPIINETVSYLEVLVSLNIFILVFIVLPYLIFKFYIVNTKILKTNLFMDEMVHSNQYFFNDHQDRSYTALNHTLILFQTLVVKPLGYLNFTRFHFSETTILRLVNLLSGLVILPFVTYSKLYALTAICFMVPSMVMFPLLSTYYNLYYPTVWSTFWIMTGLLYACTFNVDPENDTETDCKRILDTKKFNIYVSGFCCFVSLFFNKSNIFWVALIMFIGIERQTILEHDMNNIWFNNYLKVLLTALKNFKTLVIPYSFSFILYTYLSFKNKAGFGFPLHLMQIFYCLSCITLFSLPLWFDQEFIITYLVRTYGNIDRVLITALYNILIAIMIRFTSYENIEKLSDDRIITNYIFKKVLYRNFFCRYFIALPLYNFSWYTVQELLSNSLLHFPESLHPLKVHKISELPLIMTHMTRSIFFTCMSLTLIPTSVVDSKLYIIPYLIWRVYICPNQNRNIIFVLLKEFLWFWLIDMALFVIFYKVELSGWLDLGFPQRIIW